MKTKDLFLSLVAISSIMVSCNDDFVVDETSSAPQTRVHDITVSPDVTFQMNANITFNK